MSWRGVAWDIDGTLVDSEPLHHRALVAACARRGLDVRDEEAAFVGVHIGDVWAMLAPRFPQPVAQAEWLAEIGAHYAAHAGGLQALPGARETVAWLAGAGVAQVCVSNSDRAIVDANLRALGILPLLKGSISLDDVTCGKPDPEPYLKGAALLGLAPAEILAVEDSLTGARAARAAGMVVALLVPSSVPAGTREATDEGTGQKTEPGAGLADFVVSDLSGIPGLFAR